MSGRIVFVAPPFRGHLHPILGLARRVAASREVLVVSTPGGAAVAESEGLPARALLADAEHRVWEIAEPGCDVRSHPVRLHRQLSGNVALMATMKDELDHIFAEVDPRLVIADFTVPVAGLAADRRGIPWWTTLPSPCVLETPDGPPSYFGGQVPARSRWGRIRHAGMRRATRAFKEVMAWWFREDFRRMGFEGVYRKDGSEAVYSPHRILALSFPEIEFPATHPAHFHWIGPVLHTPPSAVASPGFPDDGRRRVLVTLGTHLPQVKGPAAAEVRRLAQRHPDIVFHFTHGREDSTAGPSSENFRELPYLSYGEHLSHYDLVLHHGGTGILHHCLRRGLPSVVHPLDFDQFDYAARLERFGLARRTRRFLQWEDAILTTLGDRAMRERCSRMAEISARYDAAETVAGWVDAET